MEETPWLEKCSGGTTSNTPWFTIGEDAFSEKQEEKPSFREIMSVHLLELLLR